jgi:hypothetical protein
MGIWTALPTRKRKSQHEAKSLDYGLILVLCHRGISDIDEIIYFSHEKRHFS